MFDQNDASITSDQFVVSALLYNNEKLSQIIIEHIPKRFVDVTFPADRLLNAKKVLEGDRIRATLQLLPGGVASVDRLICVHASVISRGLRSLCHPMVNNIDTLRHEEIKLLLDGITLNRNDLGKRAQTLMAARAEPKNLENRLENTEPLPIALSSLHVYNNSPKRAKITAKTREKQQETMYGYRFVIVGPVDTTLGVCHHAYSSEIGHAVINLDEFPNDNFRPVGTWIIADVIKFIDSKLDPIMWKITRAVLQDFPVDQWGNYVEVGSLGPNDNECIMKCRGIVTHLTENKHAVVFSDVLYAMLTADQLKEDGTICGIPLTTLRDHPVVDVLAQFSVSYNGDAWTVIEMTSVPNAEVKSDVLRTTDHMKAQSRSGRNLVITGDSLGEHSLFARYICGHSPEKISIGTSLRTTFAPAEVHAYDGWRVVRATAIDRVQGYNVEDFTRCQLPHIPINMDDSTDLSSDDSEESLTLEDAPPVDLPTKSAVDPTVNPTVDHLVGNENNNFPKPSSHQSTENDQSITSRCQRGGALSTLNQQFPDRSQDCKHLSLILLVEKALRSYPEVLVEMTKYDPKLVIDIINYAKMQK